MGGVLGIEIKGRGGISYPFPQDWDQWDSSVVLHELGHAFMGQNAELPPKEITINHHYWEPASDSALKMAYAEGWAHFFAGVASNSNNLRDYNNDMYYIYEIDLEQPYPDVPYVQNQSPGYPPYYQPFFNGAKTEGAIAEALWDIYDYNDDGNYYISGTLWGHNNDFNSIKYYTGLDTIMSVLLGFDPRPDSSEHDFCWTIYEFIWGWADLGYSYDTVFANIFKAHNIPVFVPGDINNDMSINILDVSYLIDYFYRGGPPPQYLVTVDVNSNCQINILDCAYLIKYLYEGGAKPLLGCATFYP